MSAGRRPLWKRTQKKRRKKNKKKGGRETKREYGKELEEEEEEEVKKMVEERRKRRRKDQQPAGTPLHRRWNPPPVKPMNYTDNGRSIRVYATRRHRAAVHVSSTIERERKSGRERERERELPYLTVARNFDHYCGDCLVPVNA